MKMDYKLLVAASSLFLATSAQAAFITSSSDASLAGANVIDFESTALGTYTSITVDDVTFTANDNHLRIDNTYQQYNQQGIYLDNGTYNNNGFGTMTMNFAGGTDAFGFTWGMAESFAQWDLSAFDAANNLLESHILPSTGPSSAGEFFGIASAGIAYATLSWTGSYDWIAVDNFTYTTTSVPEPSALLLLSVGLLGLGATTLKRKKI